MLLGYLSAKPAGPAAFLVGFPQGFEPHQKQPVSCQMAKLWDRTFPPQPQSQLFLAGRTFLHHCKLHCSIPRLQSPRKCKAEAEILSVLFNISTLLFHLSLTW